MKKYITFLLSFIIFFGRFTLADDVITPDLKEKLENADPSETFRVIVLMKDYLSVPALDQALYESRATLAERHQIVVQALQNEAAATQMEILKDLDVLESQGKVVFYRTLWIVDALYLEGIPEAIYRLSHRNDVRAILIDAPTELVKPVSGTPAAELTNNAEPGLKVINAHLLWEKDITGEGAIVMNIDSGVDGTHPALADRWLGNEVPASQAWLDLLGSTTFPVDPPGPSWGHGTHTMGTMTGLEEATNDTIGVAFAAKWIAARALGASSIKLQALQWAADPDGNPATQDDVPDVVNCSWQSSELKCDPYYWEAIDNLEAAGAAVVFAAGNSGPSSETITPPKNRATTPVNIFAVGSIDGRVSAPDLPIASYSSRGPSACDDHPIKPEAVAPGVWVRSSYKNGGYDVLNGTSMAAPHVSGAIALLRQAFTRGNGN